MIFVPDVDPLSLLEVHSQYSRLQRASCRKYFLFPAGLGTCHTANDNKNWFRVYCASLSSKLTWSDPNRKVGVVVKRKMKHTKPNNGDDDLKTTIKTTETSFTLTTILIALILSHADAIIHAKGGQKKYWSHKYEQFPEGWHLFFDWSGLIFWFFFFTLNFRFTFFWWAICLKIARNRGYIMIISKTNLNFYIYRQK